MSHNLLMVGEDGNVYTVDSEELGKIAKKIDRSSLSDDVQSHIKETVSSSGGGPVAHIIASKADIITSSKADIIVSSKADIIVSSKADIIVQ